MSDWQRMVQRWKRTLSGLFEKSSTKSRPLGVDYKMCPVCRNLVSRSEQICSYCEAELGAAPRSRSFRTGQTRSDPINPTSILFGICVLFHILVIFFSYKVDPNVASRFFSPDIRVLALMGANIAGLTFEVGELWRTTTYIFLHGGMMHLFFNIMALGFLGPMTIQNFGVRRFWLITFLSGIGGGLLSAAAGLVGWGGPSVGISGVLFGYLAVNYIHFNKYGPSQIAQSFKNYLIWGNLVMILITWMGLMPIDNFAHIGGMLVGLGLGVLYDNRFIKLKPSLERQMVVVLFLFWGFGLFRTFQYLSQQFG